MSHLCVIPMRAVYELTPAALRVLCALGTFTNKTGHCRVKQETLAEMLGTSRQAVADHVAALRKQGFVDVKKTGRSSEYRVLLDAPMQGDLASEVKATLHQKSASPCIDRRTFSNEVNMAAGAAPATNGNGTPRQRNPVWDALAEVFGEPSTPSATTLRGKTCRELKGQDPAEIIKRARWMLRTWGRNGRTPTESALTQRWDVIGQAMRGQRKVPTTDSFWKDLA